MDITLSPEDQAFREEVQAFMRDRLPPEIKHKVEMGLRWSRTTT